MRARGRSWLWVPPRSRASPSRGDPQEAAQREPDRGDDADRGSRQIRPVGNLDDDTLERRIPWHVEQEVVDALEDRCRAEEDQPAPDVDLADRSDDAGDDARDDEGRDDPRDRVCPPGRERRDRHRQATEQARRDRGLQDGCAELGQVVDRALEHVGREQDLAEEQERVRQQLEQEERHDEAAHSGEGVVLAAQRPREVQRQQLVPLVAPEEVRRLRGAEQDQEDPDGVRVGLVADRQRLFERAPTGELSEERLRRDDRDGRDRGEEPEDDRRDLGPPATPDTEGRPERVQEQGSDRMRAAEARTVVLAIADVIDRAGFDRRDRSDAGDVRGHAGGPATGPPTGPATGTRSRAATPSGPGGVSRNRSSSRWRRDSIRRSGNPSSATASRTASYVWSPASATRTARPSSATAIPCPARRSARRGASSSTSTASVPVASVNDPSGAERSNWPRSMAGGGLHARAISFS